MGIGIITPTQEKVSIYDVHEGIAINTLDLRSVVKDAQDVSLKVSQDENDLLIKLEGGESLLKFPIRVKNGTQWYQKLHVVLDSVPMQLECSGDNWSLSSAPLTFDENTKIAVITAKDVDEGNKLIVHKKAGQCTFSRLRDDLIITTDFSLGESNVFTMLLSNFYKEPKMETLSIEFNDTIISLQEKIDEINNSKLVFCSNALQITEGLSINGSELINNYDCLKFNSDKLVFLRSSDDLLLLSNQGVLSVLNYYSHIDEQWNLPIELNNSIIKPEEFRERADNPSSLRYYLSGKEGLQIYHNQPINKYQVGLVDLRDRSISDYNMGMKNGSLVLLSRDNTIVEVENWSAYSPSRKMMFVFNDAKVANIDCIIYGCGPENTIEEFRKVASVSERDANGNTKLHHAVLLKDLAEVKSLLDIGAEIDAKNNQGKTSLHLAIEKDEPNIVKFLLKKGADVNAKDNDNRTSLHLAVTRYIIPDDIKAIRLNIVTFLLNGGADVNAKDNDNRTSLHYAILGGVAPLYDSDEVFDLVQLLINQNATGINDKDASGNTPLHCAARHSTLNLVKYLIDKGADASIQNNSGKTPLDLAREKRGNAEMVSFLETNKENMQNRRYRRLVEPLVLSVIDNVESVDRNAALHIAIEGGNLDVVKSLVREVADVNTKDSNGKTILNLAIENGKLDMVEYLVDEGANIHSRNNEGWTPLHYSAYCGRRNVVELLISKGADINAKDNDGKTSFEVALEHNQIEVVNCIIVAKDKYGYTALHYAAKEGNLNLVKLLLDNGANINAKNSDGWTPLQLAAKNNKLEMVKHLIEKGADINTKNNYGWTSLHYAYAFGTSDMVKLVIKNGADINAKTNRGETPLEVVHEYGNLEVVFLERSKESIQHRIRHEHRKQRYGEHLQEGSSIGAHNHRSIAKEAENSLHNDEIDYNKAGTTSGASKPSSWINDLCGWIKEKSEVVVSNVVNGLYGDTAKELEGYKSGNIQTGSKKSEKTSSATLLNVSHSGKSPVQGISKENVSNKGWSSSRRKVEGSTNFGAALPKNGASSTASSISQVYAQPDITGLMLLVPIFMNTMGRKFVLPLLSADQPISPEKAQVYASNITNGFKEVLEQQAALKDGIGVHRFKIDFMKMQEEITGKIIGGKFNEISGILKSYAEKACPGREAGCSGRLSQKKFDKFMTEFNSIIDPVINQSMQPMLSRLEVSDVKEQQISLKPKSYLNGTSVQGHLTQARDLRLR